MRRYDTNNHELTVCLMVRLTTEEGTVCVLNPELILDVVRGHTRRVLLLLLFIFLSLGYGSQDS